jgi:hypothetical protein
MKIKILNLLLIISSLFGYLEWGANNHSFLYEGEYEVLTKIFSDPQSVVHPFTLIPLFGQVLLFTTLLQAKPSKILTYAGIGCLGLLLGFMFFTAIARMKFNILISTLPFIIIATLSIREVRKQ